MKVRKLVKTPYAAGVLAGVSLAWCWLTSGSVFFWLGAAGFCGAGWQRLQAVSQASRPLEPELTKFCSGRGSTGRRTGASTSQANCSGARLTRRANDQRRPLCTLASTTNRRRSDGRPFSRASSMLEEDMALVPTGEVGVELAEFDDFSVAEQQDQFHEAVVRVDSLYMDRYPVTNEQFQAFVDAGGYEQSSIWHPEVLPAVLDFVDKSGMPGPRLWNNGRYPPGKAKHPVIGVSWFEACAYARWAGKRLPTDAEWVKAASWPVALGTSKRRQRRYPWGQAMDRERATYGRLVAAARWRSTNSPKE